MTADDYPAPVASRPLWLMTLADLALLLVGFFVLLQATQALDGRALAKGIRDGFGNAAPTVAAPAAMPVAAGGVLDFAPGSAALPHAPTDLIAWARDSARDPRVALTVTGSTDGSSADVDAATGSAAILAADRARAVAAVLVTVAPARVVITTTLHPGHRAALVTLAFAGEHADAPKDAS